MFAAFAGLAVFAIPVGAGVDQEFPGSIQAAPRGLGIAAEGLGCAGVPGLAEVDPLFLRGGGTHLPPVPLASVPLVLGLGPCTRGFVVVNDNPVVHDGLNCCSAQGVWRDEGVPDAQDLLVAQGVSLLWALVVLK